MKNNSRLGKKNVLYLSHSGSYFTKFYKLLYRLKKKKKRTKIPHKEYPKTNTFRDCCQIKIG